MGLLHVDVGRKVLGDTRVLSECIVICIYLRKLTNVHSKGTISKGNFIFQPSIFRGQMSFSATSMIFPGDMLVFPGNVIQPLFCSATSHSHNSPRSCMAINQAVLAPPNPKKRWCFFHPKSIWSRYIHHGNPLFLHF